MTMSQVLLVASDSAFKHSLVFVLESGGFRVLSYGTLEAALAAPQAYDVGCAVVDEEAIHDREHAQKFFRIFARPVIMLVDHSRLFASVGAVRYLTKPFLGEPLLQAVHEAVATKSWS